MSESSSEYSELDRDGPSSTNTICRIGSLPRARNHLLGRLPLADHIARRYGGPGEPYDHLVQAARLGLGSVTAVNSFDVDNGADLVSFAVPTMMGEVRRHFRDHGWAVKVPKVCQRASTATD